MLTPASFSLPLGESIVSIPVLVDAFVRRGLSVL
jgi:hypothetical protein